MLATLTIAHAQAGNELGYFRARWSQTTFEQQLRSGLCTRSRVKTLGTSRVTSRALYIKSICKELIIKSRVRVAAARTPLTHATLTKRWGRAGGEPQTSNKDQKRKPPKARTHTIYFIYEGAILYLGHIYGQGGCVLPSRKRAYYAGRWERLGFD